MRNYTCAEYVNTANLRRILRARKVDRDQLAHLKSLEKRLRAQEVQLSFSQPKIPISSVASFNTSCYMYEK